MKKKKTVNKNKAEVVVEPVRGDASKDLTVPQAPEVLEDVESPPPPTMKLEAAGTPGSRLRRLLPDALKVAGAFGVVMVGLLILLNPPLVQSARPKVSYTYQGRSYTNAVLYRPLAMPNRYYIALPEKLADRYQYFAVDRRREVAALMTNSLSRSFLGMPVIKRSDPMGMDLEFRHLDHSEWRVFFWPETILFSNAVLAVRLDVK